MIVLTACQTSPSVAASVDGESITNDQLARDMHYFRFLSALNRSSCGQPKGAETQESACARFTLTNVIQEDLVKHYAAAHSISVDDAAVQQTLSQLQTNLGKDTLDAQLAEAKMSGDDLTSLVRRLLLFNDVQAALGKERLTDADLRTQYEQAIAQYTTVEVAHILVPTQQEAEKIAAEATPANFAELAKRYSQDPGSAKNGGSLGVAVESAFASQYDPTFVQAALALQPGQISEPVQTQFGWHVIEMISRRIQPFTQVRDQIVASASGQAFQRWMQGQVASADISVNPRYGVFDPALGSVEPVNSTKTDSAFQPTSSPTASATP
jgi:parvulin-like peptidyl-prolyl isomerase